MKMKAAGRKIPRSLKIPRVRWRSPSKLPPLTFAALPAPPPVSRANWAIQLLLRAVTNILTVVGYLTNWEANLLGKQNDGITKGGFGESQGPTCLEECKEGDANFLWWVKWEWQGQGHVSSLRKIQKEVNCSRRAGATTFRDRQNQSKINCSRRIATAFLTALPPRGDSTLYAV